MKLYTPEASPPWLDAAERIFRQQGACDFPCQDNENDPRRWLRQFPLGSWALDRSVEPEEYVATAYRHFTFLEDECGVDVPDLEMQVRDRSFSEPSFGPVLYVATSHVEDAREPGFTRDPALGLAVSKLAGSLHKYVEWVHESPQKLALFDVLRLSQYGFGSLAAGERKLYLIDVEPALGTTQDARDFTYQKWQDRITELHEWSSMPRSDSP